MIFAVPPTQKAALGRRITNVFTPCVHCRKLTNVWTNSDAGAVCEPCSTRR